MTSFAACMDRCCLSTNGWLNVRLQTAHTWARPPLWGRWPVICRLLSEEAFPSVGLTDPLSHVPLLSLARLCRYGSSTGTSTGTSQMWVWPFILHATIIPRMASYVVSHCYTHDKHIWDHDLIVVLPLVSLGKRFQYRFQYRFHYRYKSTTSLMIDMWLV